MNIFGKKKKESMTMNPSFNQDEFEDGDMINQAFDQDDFNPQLPTAPMPRMNAQQQGYQPSVMHQQVQQEQYQPPIQQQVQQPIQQMQPIAKQKIFRVPPKPQFQPMAKIIKSEETMDGEYIYVVVTNYPLGLGDCQLSQ